MIDLNPVPDRVNRPDTLEDDADSFFQKLPQFAADLLAIYAAVGASQAGGAFALTYTFTTGAIVGSTGKSSFAAGAQNATTHVYLNNVIAGQNLAATLARFGSSTSSTKGTILLSKVGDPSKWMRFTVMGATPYADYYDMGGAVLDASSANPFAANDALVLQFTPNGDKGDQGNAANLDGPMIHVREEMAANSYPTVTSGTARALNTVKANTITGASLSAGAITLPAGTYTFEGFSPISANGVAHRVGLYNQTAASMILYGPAVLMANNANGDAAISTVRGRFTLAVQSVVQLVPTLFGTTSTAGGFAMNSGTEVYAELLIRKVA